MYEDDLHTSNPVLQMNIHLCLVLLISLTPTHHQMGAFGNISTLPRRVEAGIHDCHVEPHSKKSITNHGDLLT